jgi:hypothetical protein
MRGVYTLQAEPEWDSPAAEISIFLPHEHDTNQSACDKDLPMGLAIFRSHDWQPGSCTISGKVRLGDNPGTTSLMDPAAFAGTNPETAANIYVARRSGGISAIIRD